VVGSPDLSVYVNRSPGVSAVTVIPGKINETVLSTGKNETTEDCAGKVVPSTIRVGSRVTVGMLVQSNGKTVVRVKVKAVGVRKS